MIENVTDLANAGLAGVAIALIIGQVILIRAVLKLVGNHMNHNTASNEKLAGSIREMIRLVERKTK